MKIPQPQSVTQLRTIYNGGQMKLAYGERRRRLNVSFAWRVTSAKGKQCGFSGSVVLR